MTPQGEGWAHCLALPMSSAVVSTPAMASVGSPASWGGGELATLLQTQREVRAQ